MVGRWNRGSKDRYATIAPPISGLEGHGVAAPISWRVRTQAQAAHLRTAHPKLRTQKKHLTLETYRASAPRIRVRPGWSRGARGVSLEQERSGGNRSRSKREGRGECARNGWKAGRGGEPGRSLRHEPLGLRTESGDLDVKQHATWGLLEPVTCPHVDTSKKRYAAGRKMSVFT